MSFPKRWFSLSKFAYIFIYTYIHREIESERKEILNPQPIYVNKLKVHSQISLQFVLFNVKKNLADKSCINYE
jgi:hypothetical protein